MRKSLIFVGLIIALLASSLVAQEAKIAIKSDVIKSRENLKQLKKSRTDILWDNTEIAVTQTGLVSTELGGAGMKAISADDFVVPMGVTWDIDEIWVDGFASSASEPESFTVAFYEDNEGAPGNLIVEVSGIAADMTDGYLLDLTSQSTEFAPGTYWVAVWGYYSASALADGRWNWFLGAAPIGNEAMLFDEGLFGGFDWTTMTDLGLGDYKSFMFAISGNATIQGPGYADGANPADGGIDVPVEGTTLTWTNPDATSFNAVYFGTDEALVTARDASVKVLGDDATVYTSYDPGELEYGIQYYWVVDETEDAKSPGTTYGHVWTFITEFQYPIFEWVDDFETGLDNWIVEGVNGSNCEWEIDDQPWHSSYGGIQMPPTASGNIVVANEDLCGAGTTMDTYLTMDKGVDLTDFGNSVLDFDMDQRAGGKFQIEVSVDGGVTWVNVYDETTSNRAAHMTIDISDIADFQADVKVRFHYEVHGWQYWWALDNVSILAETPLNPVEGTLTYANGNAVANSSFMLYNETKYVFIGETDADGHYLLPEVPPGEYDFAMVSETPDGAVNVLDAYLVSQQAMKIADYPEGHMFFVSDVDGDMEVRYQDAQMIFARIFGDIDSYERDDWYSANPSLVDFGNHIYVNLPELLIATGDADLTYGESVKPTRTLSLEKSSINTIPLTEELEVPFFVGSDAEVTGLMLRFDYDNTAYTFTGVKSNLDKPYIIDGDGFISVMVLNADAKYAAGDELLTLKFRVNDGVDVPEDFEVTLDEKSALMNKNGDLINTSLQTVTFGEVLPSKYDLSQNYPNPFNPSTKISFSLPQADVVTLKIYDILGSEVATLVNGKMEAGKYEINFDASNLPSGAYIYRIQTNNFQATKKMMLLK